MIHIDPPYNTGNDFIYRDNFAKSKDEYEEDLGMYDEDGNRLFKNTETNGRFHSDWRSMIYPRLMLARNLLTDDGVIFISIDNNEVAQLRKVCGGPKCSFENASAFCIYRPVMRCVPVLHFFYIF
jgi:adenine-specific DNA-methyltransferase